MVEGAELLAHLIHPARFSWNGPTAFRALHYLSEPVPAL
jgi:hypothetical protein